MKQRFKVRTTAVIEALVVKGTASSRTLSAFLNSLPDFITLEGVPEATTGESAVTAKEREEEEIEYCKCDDLNWKHRHTGPYYPFKVPRPTSTQKIEEILQFKSSPNISQATALDLNELRIKLNEVIRAWNKGITQL